MLVVYIGQDTEFANASPLDVDVDTKLNLEGFTAEIKFFGITKTFSTEIVQTKKLPLSYTAAETKTFFPGLNFADLYLFDTEGRQAIYSKIQIAVKLSGDNAVDYIEANTASARYAKLKEIAAELPNVLDEDPKAKIITICNEMMSALRFNGEFEAQDTCKIIDKKQMNIVKKIRQLQEFAQTTEDLDENSTTIEIRQTLQELMSVFENSAVSED